MANSSPDILKSPRVCHVLEFGICKTAQKPLGVMQIWYFFWNYIFLLDKIVWYWILGYFGSAPSNVLKMISYQDIRWFGNANQNLETMSRDMMPDISYLTVFLSGHALKHFKTVGICWGILEWGLLHFITRSIAKIMYEPIFTEIHSQKQEMQHSNIKKIYYPHGGLNYFG